MYLSIYLLNLLDYFATLYWITKYGVEIESNPLSRFLFENHIMWIFKVILVGYLVIFLKKRDSKLSHILLLVYSILGLYHFYLLTYGGNMKTYLLYVLTIACLMLAQTIIKSAEVIIKKEFDWKTFLQGALKHLLICGGTFLMYLGGSFVPTLTIIGETTIIDALNLVAVALIVKTGVACIDNLKKVYDVEINKEIG